MLSYSGQYCQTTAVGRNIQDIGSYEPLLCPDLRNSFHPLQAHGLLGLDINRRRMVSSRFLLTAIEVAGAAGEVALVEPHGGDLRHCGDVCARHVVVLSGV
jgi:hypothetical protein